jgi:hypothetical protein
MGARLRIIGVCSVLVLVSCELAVENSPPYVISAPVSFCEERPGYYAFAGVEFNYHNLRSDLAKTRGQKTKRRVPPLRGDS